jgi:hypothetical protein
MALNTELFSEAFVIASTLAVTGLALLKGDQPERYGVAIMFVAWVGSNLLMDQPLDRATLTNALFAIDIVVLISLAGLAWASRRAWAIFATVMQALQVFIHVARDMGLPINDLTYFYALTVSGYGQLAAVLLGTIVAWRERAALASFGIVDQPGASSPASARATRSSLDAPPKIATRDRNRASWF